MSVIVASDPRLSWSGTISCEMGDGWVKPWRIPYQERDLFAPGDGGLAVRAEMPSGVRLRFATDAEELKFHTEPLGEGGNFDLYADDRLVATQAYVAAQTEVSFEGLAQTRHQHLQRREFGAAVLQTSPHRFNRLYSRRPSPYSPGRLLAHLESRAREHP